MNRPANSITLGCSAGVGIGAVVPVLGYLLLRLMNVVISDPMLITLLAVPVVLCAALFAVPSVRAWAPGLLIGAVLGVILLVGVVGGGIGLIAWMLSD